MVKKLAVIVTTPPNNHLTQSAFQLISQAISDGIHVIGVFFYKAGVLNASRHLAIPVDEFPLIEKWQSINSLHYIPLYLCSTAAEKHGLINNKHPLSTELIHPEFTISGLGELVMLTLEADRLVQM